MSGRDVISQVAKSVPFNNRTNGFTANNVQDAIEEIYERAVLLEVEYREYPSGFVAIQASKLFEPESMNTISYLIDSQGI